MLRDGCDLEAVDALAVVFEEPKRLSLSRLELTPPADGEVVVDVDYSGISTGTERLLWTGQMPPFPGMGYPLVPGYESVGRVVEASGDLEAGDTVFVPGARCFGSVRGLFGGTASRLVVPRARLVRIADGLGAQGALLALAATAFHVLDSGRDESRLPDLIVGHGVLGRLLARLAVGRGGRPMVWETNPARQSGAEGYEVRLPSDDDRHDYRTIIDVSGDASLVDALIGRLAREGELVLAGFYRERIAFAFPPAFMKEARLRVAAEWKPSDLAAVNALVSEGRLNLDGLITHRYEAERAEDAYRTAFSDPGCLKMLLDWRGYA